MAAFDPVQLPQPAGTPSADPVTPPSFVDTTTVLVRFCAVMAAVLAVASLPASSLLAVRTVRVEGMHTVLPTTVVAASGVRPGDRLLGVSPSAVARAVETLPLVARSRVTLSLAGVVLVRIEERVPYAAIPVSARYLIVDRDGVVMTGSPSPGGLIMVSASSPPPAWLRPGQRLPAGALRTALETIEELPAAARPPGTTLRAESTGELVLITPDRIAVRLGLRRGVGERAAVLAQVLQAVRERALPLEYVDLRFAGSVVIKPRAAGGAGAGDQP